MAVETTDKSIVVWHTRLTQTIPDARVFTSLCLFNDQVVLPLGLSPERFVRYYLEKKIGQGWTIPFLLAKLTFYKSIELLREEAVIQTVNLSEFLTDEQNLQTILTFPNEVKKQLRIIIASEIKGEGLHEGFMSYALAKIHDCMLVSDYAMLRGLDNMSKSPDFRSEMLAQSTICQLALPDVKAIHVEDILKARTELKDELLEFRAGILKLTWLLHQQVQNKNDMKQIRQEANTLVNTIIKGSLLSLENRMRQHKKKTIRRMLFGTGRVLVEATKLFLPSGAAEKMISGGKSLFQLATEIDNVKPPEDQVATYLYKLRGKLKT